MRRYRASGTATFSTAAIVHGQDPGASVDAIFKDFASDRLPGCAAGATRADRRLFAKAYGMADLEHGVPLTPHSPFYMASVSKQFMALAVLLLERDGKLRFDDHIRNYVPELPDYSGSITIRHLLHHTSGLRDYLTLTSLAGHPPDYVITERTVLKTLARQGRLNFEPGSEHLYSNSGYVVLSIVVQRLTGRPLDEWARDRIFTPLGMGSTRFQHDHASPIPGRAIGYVRRGDTWRIANSMLDVVGDGGMYSTVDDMLRWASAFARSEFASLLSRMQTPGSLNDGRAIPSGYGMGLVQGTYRGVPTVVHGGALVGYRTALLRLPAQKLTIVTLCNNSTAVPARLAQLLAELYAGDEMKAVAPPIATQPPPPANRLTVSSELRQALVGVFYSAELDATYRIFAEGDQLMLEAGNNAPGALTLIGPDRLRLTTGPELTPIRNAAGKMTAFTLSAGRVGDLEFIRR